MTSTKECKPWNKGIKSGIEPVNKTGRFYKCLICEKSFWVNKFRLIQKESTGQIILML